MDNLGSHKRSAVRKAIRAAGAHLLFLPPERPELNPIEHNRGFSRTHGVRPLIFAKLKHLMRTASERIVEAVWKRLGSLLDTLSPKECANDLRNAGCASA